MRIGQDPSANAQHHRPVPLHERGEGKLRGFVATGQESLEKLSIGESAQALRLKKDLDLPGNRSSVWLQHRPGPRSSAALFRMVLQPFYAGRGADRSRFVGMTSKQFQSGVALPQDGFGINAQPAVQNAWHRRRENRR